MAASDARPTATRPVVAALGYHKIGTSPPVWESWYYVPEDVFVRHLELVTRGGWTVVSLEDLLAARGGGIQLPDRCVLLTFDDGYRSFMDAAVRVLSRFNLPAVLFVPTDHIAGWNAFDNHRQPHEAICDWADLRALADAGVAVESHAASHRAFSTLSSTEVTREVRDSRAALEAGLGRAVRVLSYPYGDRGRDSAATDAALVASGYAAAFLYGGGATPWPPVDWYGIPRLAIGPDTDLETELAAALRAVDSRSG